MMVHEIDDRAVKGMLNWIIDDLLCELSFEMHRALKTGQMSLEELYSVSKFTAKQTSGMDYRDAKFKKDEESMETFDCANCHRPVHALRYAPHLDKCMGLGRRTGSRVISYATQDFSSKVDPPSNVDEDYVPLGAQSSSSMKDQE